MSSSESVEKPMKESVWDYPRPPRLEPTAQHLRIELAGEVVADTRTAFRVLETSHPPVYYIPPGDVAHLIVMSENLSFNKKKFGQYSINDKKVQPRRDLV